jgi:hypothetical protein
MGNANRVGRRTSRLEHGMSNWQQHVGGSADKSLLVGEFVLFYPVSQRLHIQQRPTNVTDPSLGLSRGS